uniref:Cell division cycle associated 3 n=1 Tax=Strix occidentalis caurina TaxID=311401 RepID=A0A8D0EPP7_STROC
QSMVQSLPTKPCHPHLAHVSDPRSPSAGILRTPIEVLSSPVGSPQPGPAEPAAGACQDRDPRSPTPGISRTPMRAESSGDVDRLVKQLSEAFGAEAAPQQPSPPGAACPAGEPAAEEPAWRSSPGPEVAVASREEAERPLSPGAAPARPAHLAGPSFSSGECSLCRDTLTCFFLSLGSKPVRRKTNNKIMATSGGTGRSPLSILQDDNSPSASAPRQGKRHVLGENLGEKKEVTVDLSRNLKSGNCAWSDLNKENQQCPFVEN